MTSALMGRLPQSRLERGSYAIVEKSLRDVFDHVSSGLLRMT